jgi:hypothetical protein
MTSVRQSRDGRPEFIRQAVEEDNTQARLRTERQGESPLGPSIRPLGLDTWVFLSDQRKGSAPRPAAALRVGFGAPRRRSLNHHQQLTMNSKSDTSTGSISSADSLVAAPLRRRYEGATREPADGVGGPPARSVVAPYPTGVMVRNTGRRPPARAHVPAHTTPLHVEIAATPLRPRGTAPRSCDYLVAPPALRPLRTPLQPGLVAATGVIA